MTEISRAAAFPTETVYGLGADARNPQAVAKIFAAKGRPADHPLIVHVPDASHLDRWAIDIPESAHKLAGAFWPGPLTLILKRHPSVSDVITGGQDTVGLRVPNHPLTLQLLREFGGGVAAPSANRFGRVSPTTAAHVREELGGAVALILDGGPCAVGIESTILDLSGGAARILRPGMLDATTIATVLGSQPVTGGTREAPRVSGSLEAHYAPQTPLRIVAAATLGESARAALDAGKSVAVLSAEAPHVTHERLNWCKAAANPEQYAHDLYAHLRELDTKSCDLILVTAPLADHRWNAVADRLKRAAASSK